ncbi:MAG: sigma-70 family RNA polymerase sigma factor [Muribaculaceae bacterium]|nr:sigma-70 family RNA polymerase sigma factor [Muribaculaceae bacterium]
MTSGEFKSILLPCYRRMFATAMAILRNGDDASDAVQDTVSALWQRHAGLSVPDNVVAFCCRAVRNTCIDRLRLDSKRYFDNIEGLCVADASVTSDRDASLNTMSEYIATLLSGFKEKQRRILMLSIFSELSNDEISVITGETNENVRMIISRGRKKLKEYLTHEL